MSDDKYSLDVPRLFGHSETLYPFFNTMILNMYFHNYDRVVVLPTETTTPLFFLIKLFLVLRVTPRFTKRRHVTVITPFSTLGHVIPSVYQLLYGAVNNNNVLKLVILNTVKDTSGKRTGCTESF